MNTTGPKQNVVIGLLGSVLDRGRGTRRWEAWRPTVSICRHEDFLVSRLELLYERKFLSLAKEVEADIRTVSPETEVRLHLVEFKDAWDFEEVYGVLLDFARGYEFQTEQEQYLIHITTGTHVAQICLFLLAESRHLPGRLLQTAPPGRHDLTGPGKFSIIDLDLSRYDRIAARYEVAQTDARQFLKGGIATRNERFNRMIAQIEHVAMHSSSPILLLGPTGAGKSQLARRIYELKRARHQVAGSFVEVNCATLRGDAAMSTLFGHEKGAFTGALVARSGLLRSAEKGILFLDEIGELGRDEQAMLLRALEEKRFLPMGSDRETTSDFQLIAGTNQDLKLAVKQGKFRADLLARINLWTYQLPGLQERPEDLEPNLDYELELFSRNSGRRITMSREVRARFLDFAQSPEAVWSANFRDLNAAITRMATLAPGGRITSETLQEELGRLRQTWKNPETKADKPERLSTLFSEEALTSLDLFDRVQLEFVAGVCFDSPSLSEAGRRLYQASREKKKLTNDADRLRKYLARFGLQWCKETAGNLVRRP